ncbi:MAG: thymidine phosphorylase [Candidatus Thermoplasmatota archaeon]|nr:thymidine phosphorylase [Candidatus Thermoplasmatota archaeon]MEE3082815.1 thymidine phosphorylase [Candidatus Thermoplasmatota archaeon]
MSEIRSFVDGVVDNSLSDDEVENWMRHVYENGLSTSETVELTDAMIHSGTVLKWPHEWKHLVVDKHSTGGIGDKVSLPLAPALAACGLKCPMIAGRGLAHTGGTLDKLESLPGYDVAISPEKAYDMVDRIGCMIGGQTGEIAPADKRMYAIRDVTGLIASVPLITGSIVSKKAAEGLHALVMDIKVGNATFMKDLGQAKELARSIVSTGEGLGITTKVTLTEMDTPIGYAAGNALEVLESIETLRGYGPADLEELVCVQGGILLHATGLVESIEEGAHRIHDSLIDGSALSKFEEMCIAQGVSPAVFSSERALLDAIGLLDSTLLSTEFTAVESGWVSDIDAMALGQVVLELGGGRKQLGDEIDRGVGFVLDAHIGSQLQSNENWITIYHRKPLSETHRKSIRDALTLSEGMIDASQRIIEIL